MNVLITGASGFVGGALLGRLCAYADHVVGTWRSFNPETWPLGHIASMEYGDVVDFDFLYRVLVDHEVDVVIHQAAQSIVQRCEADPVSAYQTNVMGTLAVLEACRWRMQIHPNFHPFKAVIIATTDKVYGDGPVPYAEDQRLRPKGPYSTSKVAADFVAQDYLTTYGLPVIVVRSSNIYGPGDTDETRVIPGNIARLLRGESARLYEAALTMEREFVYIDDEVDAYMTLIERGEPGIYNVGGSGPVPIANVIRMLSSLCEGTFNIEKSKFREISRQYVDAGRLRALGWDQKVSLMEGLHRTVEWHKTRKGIPQLAEVEP